jgi:hypothetical protein
MLLVYILPGPGTDAAFTAVKRKLFPGFLRGLFREDRIPVFLVGGANRFWPSPDCSLKVRRLLGRHRSWIGLHPKCFCPSGSRFLEQGRLWLFCCRGPSSFLTLSGRMLDFTNLMWAIASDPRWCRRKSAFGIIEDVGFSTRRGSF